MYALEKGEAEIARSSIVRGLRFPCRKYNTTSGRILRHSQAKRPTLGTYPRQIIILRCVSYNDHAKLCRRCKRAMNRPSIPSFVCRHLKSHPAFALHAPDRVLRYIGYGGGVHYHSKPPSHSSYLLHVPYVNQPEAPDKKKKSENIQINAVEGDTQTYVVYHQHTISTVFGMWGREGQAQDAAYAAHVQEMRG